MNSISVFVLAAVISAWAGLAVAQHPPPAFERPHLYVLAFNRWGDLVNPLERDLVASDLANDPRIRRVVIVSYGWANDGESSTATYAELLRDMAEHAERTAEPGSTAVIAVGWDSSQTGFRKLLNDLSPLPVIADALAFVPDKLLFPISFWSKGAMADRIGFGGLRTTLNEVFSAAYPDGQGVPDIYLVGHSFGTRIVSGLMQDRLSLIPVRAEPFVAADHVRGAVLLQPALAEAALHGSAHYPILVTQSEHDHANSFLFPLANSVLNSFTFTMSEALIDKQVLAYFESGLGLAVGTAVGTVRGVASLPQRVIRQGRKEPEAVPAEEDAEKEEPGPPGLARKTLYLLRRSLVEVASIPASIAFTVVATPVGYVNTQIRLIVAHPVDHVMDTLAQLPLVEVPVEGIGRALNREVRWGRRSKGFFHLGALNESVGRSVTPRLGLTRVPEVYTPEDLHALYARAEDCGLPTCGGIVIVDASAYVRDGIYGQNMERLLTDTTLGWLDPIGAHADYRNREVVRLLALPLFRP